MIKDPYTTKSILESKSFFLRGGVKADNGQVFWVGKVLMKFDVLLFFLPKS